MELHYSSSIGSLCLASDCERQFSVTNSMQAIRMQLNPHSVALQRGIHPSQTTRPWFLLGTVSSVWRNSFVGTEVKLFVNSLWFGALIYGIGNNRLRRVITRKIAVGIQPFLGHVSEGFQIFTTSHGQVLIPCVLQQIYLMAWHTVFEGKPGLHVIVWSIS